MKAQSLDQLASRIAIIVRRALGRTEVQLALTANPVLSPEAGPTHVKPVLKAR